MMRQRGSVSVNVIQNGITPFLEGLAIVDNPFKKTQQMFDNSLAIEQQQQTSQNKQVPNINDHPDKAKFLESQAKKQNMGSKNSMATYLKKTHETQHIADLDKTDNINNNSNVQDQDSKQEKSLFKELLIRLKAKIYFKQWRKFMPSRIIKVLGTWHYNLLSDKTIGFDSEKKDLSFLQDDKINNNGGDEGFYLSELKNFQNDEGNKPKGLGMIKHLISNIPLISASGNFRLLWDILQMIIIMAFQCFMPIYITFNVPFYDIVGTTAAYLMYFALIGDILVNMNTSYYEKGRQVKNRKRVIIKYIKTSFLLDILPIIPITIDFFLIKFSNDILRFIFLLFVIKLKRMYSILSKIQDRFHLISSINSYMQLFNLLIVHLLVSHYFACLWLIIGRAESGYTWLSKRGIDSAEWPTQYINSYYFITLTMITVGYGDITPVTNTEIGLCIGTMTFACGVFAYSVNEIGTLIQDLRSKQKEIKTNLQTIQNYMHNKNISNELKYEIREYLHYYWTEESNKNSEKENTIINQLSDSLKQTLVIEANHIVLKDSPVFRDNFSPEILRRTVPLIKEFRCTPEEIIYFEGEMDDGCIYFLEKGSVELYIDISTGIKEQFKPLKQLKKGDNFGTIGFFTGLHRTQSVRSLEFSTLLMIRRDEFMALLQEFPQDYERFCYLRDKILIQHDYQKLGLRCYSCRSFYHVLNDCPYLHFVPNRFKVIRNAITGNNSRKKDFQRINILKYRRTLMIQQDIDQQAKIYLEENEDLIDYLFDFLDGTHEQQNTNENNSYFKYESMGAAAAIAAYTRDFSVQQSGIQEEDIKTSSVKQIRKGKQRNTLLPQMPQYKSRQSQDENAGGIPIVNSPLPTLEVRRSERKGTIQIQNHRGVMKKLSRIPSQESTKPFEKSLTKSGTEKNLSHFATLNIQETMDFVPLNLDLMKNFHYYFPHNNAERVLRKNTTSSEHNRRYWNQKKRSKRSTLRSTNKVETSSLNSLANKFEQQKDQSDEFCKQQSHNTKYQSKNSVFSRHSLKQNSNFSQKSHHNTTKLNNQQSISNNLDIKSLHDYEENLHSGSESKFQLSSDEVDLAVSIPLDGESLKNLTDEKWGQSTFGPQLKINFLKTPQSYFQSEIGETVGGFIKTV